MLFNDMKDGKCPECGKDMKDLLDGTVVCKPCDDSFHLESAKASTLQHFFLVFYCLYHFEFYGVFMELLWTIQRLTKTGFYGQHGEFTILLKREERNKQNKQNKE